jgi:hypothetical protein
MFWGHGMYRKPDRNQLSLDKFFLPFGGRLSADNRWAKIAELLPWDMIEDVYAESFKNEKTDGRQPMSSRIAFGAIFIKEHENLTDESTVLHIAENPYMQYFLGLQAFRAEPLFDPSMMTHFRKRFPSDIIEKINEELYRRMNPPKPPEKGSNDGTLILDATVAPADIRYPTDLGLLNECRENTEKTIDEIWAHTNREGHKTAYNRKKARKQYLQIIKKRRHKAGEIKAGIKEQLGYVKKNLETLERLANELTKPLGRKRLERLATIREVVKQQEEMLAEEKHAVENRIVSLRQPHVRPIVRGKAGRPVEFGQKLEFSVVNGFTFTDRQSWDNFNEGVTLMQSAEKYKERHGVYPEAILADKVFRNKANADFCKRNGIRFSGQRLGRPKKDGDDGDSEQARADSGKRNIVESRNGIAKRRYGLNLIMTRLECTSATEAALNVLIMNVAHVIRALLRLFFEFRFWRFFRRGELIWTT